MGRFSKLERNDGEALAPQGAAAAVPAAVPKAAESDVIGYAELLGRADEFYFAGNSREALRFYSRAVQSDSTQVTPWVGQIACLLELQQYNEARVWADRALDVFPEEPRLLNQRARVHAFTGDLRRAIQACDYAMSKGAATPDCWLARGDILLLARDVNARFCFDKAVEIAGPEDWRVRLLAGLSYSRERQWATAHEFLGAAAALNTRNAHLWSRYAQALSELNFTDRAREAARRAIELDPTNKSAKAIAEAITNRGLLDRLAGFFRRGPSDAPHGR